MIIAVRDKEVFANWQDRYTEDEIVNAPYSYELVLLPNFIDVNNVKSSDIVSGQFDVNKYNERIRLASEGKYAHKVSEMIRQQYAIDDELSLLRQKDVKPDEFAIYNEYCENCKQMIKNPSVQM